MVESREFGESRKRAKSEFEIPRNITPRNITNGAIYVGVRIAHTASVEVYSKTLAPVDYHVIGDIFSQYLYTTRSSEAFPIRCIIPDSPKFGNYKPIPTNGKSISVTGFLTGLKHNEDKTVKHFITSRSLASQWDLLRQRPKSVRPRYVSNSTPANLKFTGFFCEWLQSEESAPTKQPARN
ncbi:hypothetical protein B0H14DRAFT_2605438 [Mycena olivaceomarginata]|nr:hypothetical protein B0H14DRAFT_2605438 [Mycena olivaceomarginata]